jgi:membrane protease YdiL (CAAX protease family)
VRQLVAPRSGLGTAALLAGFGAAVALRVAVGGVGVARSVPAGLVFAGALAALTLAAGPLTSSRPAGTTLPWAVAGTAVLCLPAVLTRLATGSPAAHATGFLRWAAVVTVVAVAEEAFLRGALYDQLLARHGHIAAVTVSTLCFTALHLPLYGWRAAPLDAAAGLWLATLRARSGTWIAPALTHTAADLLAWTLR